MKKCRACGLYMFHGGCTTKTVRCKSHLGTHHITKECKNPVTLSMPEPELNLDLDDIQKANSMLVNFTMQDVYNVVTKTELKKDDDKEGGSVLLPVNYGNDILFPGDNISLKLPKIN